MEKFIMPIMNDTSIPYIKLTSSTKWQNNIILTLLKLGTNEESEVFSLLHNFLCILELLTENYLSVNKVAYNDRNLSDLAAMLGYIQTNYENRISIKELSEAGNCCKTKCSELFKKYLHTSPNQYINNYRLEKSTQKLAGTNQTISEVAYSCGFTSSSYFCEAFHKQFGITPKQYRLRVKL